MWGLLEKHWFCQRYLQFQSLSKPWFSACSLGKLPSNFSLPLQVLVHLVSGDFLNKFEVAVLLLLECLDLHKLSINSLKNTGSIFPSNRPANDSWTINCKGSPYWTANDPMTPQQVRNGGDSMKGLWMDRVYIFLCYPKLLKKCQASTSGIKVAIKMFNILCKIPS